MIVKVDHESITAPCDDEFVVDLHRIRELKYDSRTSMLVPIKNDFVRTKNNKARMLLFACPSKMIEIMHYDVMHGDIHQKLSTGHFATLRSDKCKQIMKLLGFVINDSCASFVTPFQSYSVEIKESQPLCLDDCGLNCIACVTTSISDEIKLLEKSKLLSKSTEEFGIVVNGLKMNVAFVQGCGGEIYELIQILR